MTRLKDWQVRPKGSDTNKYNFGKATLYAEKGGRLDILCKELKEEFPKLKMYNKSSSIFWATISILHKIVTFGMGSNYIARFSTTLHNSIWWSQNHWNDIMTSPIRDSDDCTWATLLHEREHLRQFKKYTFIGMLLLYALVPIPIYGAWFRARFERDGYNKTLEAWFLTDRRYAESEDAKKWYVWQFTGPNYLYMWKFRKQVEGWYDLQIAELTKQYAAINKT